MTPRETGGRASKDIRSGSANYPEKTREEVQERMSKIKHLQPVIEVQAKFTKTKDPHTQHPHARLGL